MEGARMASTAAERNRAALRRLIDEGFNQGNLAVAHELIAPDAVEHEELPPGIEGTAPEQFNQLVTLLRAGIPDLRVGVEDMLAEGDKVVARMTMRGTHRGELLGIPASGRSVAVAVIDIVRFGADCVMVEHWGQMDNLGLLQQIGAIPAPGGG
jgi:predicted ester cyclase